VDVGKMGESFEFHKKLTKIQDELRKREVDVRNRLADIEKKRVEALKRTEEMKYSALHDIEKIEQSIMKGKFDPETKKGLLSEIASLKTEMEKKYLELRSTTLGKANLP
jgi:predicted transcriptional regulator